ncbi:hypothetical protein Tco_1087022, partial [Tanacetum coccineum]
QFHASSELLKRRGDKVEENGGFIPVQQRKVGSWSSRLWLNNTIGIEEKLTMNGGKKACESDESEIGVIPCQFLNDKGYNRGFEEGDIGKAFVAMKENYEAWVCGFATLAIGADVPVARQEFGHCSTCSQTFQYIHIPDGF